jgi:phenylpropionate dioxygenase-like ring-hydroxylating dioxygenase large terminal subunit
MIKAEGIDALTEVAPGTPMGRLLRQYWTPVIRSAALLADGAPERIRLLGESWVAFRASDGRVGVLDEACPHRCASLMLARNEDCALRCVFHGWKISVDGRVLEIPNERADRAEALVTRVRVRSLPVREAAGLVWVLPDPASGARFPDFEFMRLPAAQIHVRAGRVNCHWLQVVESVLDAAHLGYLHRDTVLRATTAAARANALLWIQQSAPELEVEATEYGFREAAIRPMASGARNIKIREVVTPWFVFLPAEAQADRQVIITVPNDATHSTQFVVQFNSLRPMTEAEIEALWAGASPDPDNFAANMPGPDKTWGQDRGAMQAGHFSGLTNLQVFCEDFAILESMGAITPRAKEHLTRSDASIMFNRQQLLKSLRALATGDPPVGLGPETIDFARIRSLSCDMEPGVDWREFDVLASSL